MIIKIRTPIWKSKSVGINKKYMTGEDIKVKILYKEKTGNLLWPNVLTMKSSKALTYSTMYIRGNTIHIIPIADFENN